MPSLHICSLVLISVKRVTRDYNLLIIIWKLFTFTEEGEEESSKSKKKRDRDRRKKKDEEKEEKKKKPNKLVS